MKQIFSLLTLLVFYTITMAQKPEDNAIKFDYIQLPLTPFSSNIDSYSQEFVIQNEQELLQLKADSEADFEKKVAEFEQTKAQAMAEYEYKRDHFDEFVEDAKKEHEIQLEAYNKTLETMGMLEKLAYKENNPPPKFVMPKRPTSPPYFTDPVYYPPHELEILGKKELMESTYLRISGYDIAEDAPIIVKATLYPFEAKDPVSETQQQRYYDSGSKTYKYKTVTITTIEGKYPISLEVIDKTTNQVLLNEMIGGDFISYQNQNNSYIETDLLDNNLQAVQAILNDLYGYPVMTRYTTLYTIKPKKYEYPEYQTAFENAMSFYNTLKYEDQDLSASMEEAIGIWNTALTEYDPNDSKARIDEDVAKATYYNLVEASLWLNDFDQANMYLTKLFAFNLKNKEKEQVEVYKDFINMQKERYLANN